MWWDKYIFEVTFTSCLEGDELRQQLSSLLGDMSMEHDECR
jgi:hypothetical protein